MSDSRTDHVAETVERLADLHRRHREESTHSQRLANRVTRALGRPATIAIVIAFVAAWVLGNLSARPLHLTAIEPAPFPELALVLGIGAVVVALLILSTQQHGEQLAERRSELTLQIALLSERKIAKVISLLEEQRAENPLLANRPDTEAEQMAEAADADDTLSRIAASREREPPT